MLSQNVNRCEITPTGVCDEHKLIVEGDPERQIQNDSAKMSCDSA
jgi:hypothetical protein